jgi:4-hydroxy-3-polyprenylbenzoate decarboxylase
VVRETPLHKGHLKLLWQAADIGATILPPAPAFYHGPKRIEDLIDHTVGKILDCLHIEHGLYRRWDGSNRIGEGNEKGPVPGLTDAV